MNFKPIAIFLIHSAASVAAQACDTPVSVCGQDTGQGFGLIRAGQPVAIYVDAGADPAVKHVSRNFAADLERVSGKTAALLSEIAAAQKEVVIIGVLGQSPVIDRLVAEGRLTADDLKGQWEAYRQVVVERPFTGVERALVIVGADRRGAVFGSYDLSAKIGVSPWYWWADVPVARRADVFITAGARRDQPTVKYRGIFINDEAPALSTWARAKFGGINATMYATVFELLLRLKGNYLWPAMWQPSAFNADDPQSMVLADEMGVVMGTSHHEPMMRAHDEWSRFKGAKWDYKANAPQLREFWRGGISRMLSKPDGSAYESLVTVGMRGDGDEPMSEGTATRLLENIVADQRQIIASVTGKPAAQTPQMWALYKEVQDYHDQGMQVPDDVLLLFCDDNWGNVRRLPQRGGKDRKGGYGVYYHFDYVGGPRNYKWLNTNQIEKTWQQMNLAHAYGADQLWIVNVGDIKPMEFPISFFLDMAWAPAQMTPTALNGYAEQWAAASFGPKVAQDIGAILTRYSQYAARRKPELIDSRSFALGEAGVEALDGGEFGQMVAGWEALERQVAAVKKRLRADQLDAYFQLVEHPVTALANFYKLYYAVAWNRKLAAAHDARANQFADLAEAAFKRDQAISDQYHEVSGGKWAGMMKQTHIGYSGWQEPKTQIMPTVLRVAEGQPAPTARMVTGQAVAAPGVIAIEAPSFSRAVAGQGLRWTVLPNLGRTLGAITALPQGRGPSTVADDVRVDYDIVTTQSGDASLQVYLVPTLDTAKGGGVKLAVGIDDRPPQVLKLDLVPTGSAPVIAQERAWEDAVRDNAVVLSARFKGLAAGQHVIRLWRLDDNAVVQKLVLDQGGAKPSYLGP